MRCVCERFPHSDRLGVQEHKDALRWPRWLCSFYHPHTEGSTADIVRLSIDAKQPLIQNSEGGEHAFRSYLLALYASERTMLRAPVEKWSLEMVDALHMVVTGKEAGRGAFCKGAQNTNDRGWRSDHMSEFVLNAEFGPDFAVETVLNECERSEWRNMRVRHAKLMSAAGPASALMLLRFRALLTSTEEAVVAKIGRFPPVSALVPGLMERFWPRLLRLCSAIDNAGIDVGKAAPEEDVVDDTPPTSVSVPGDHPLTARDERVIRAAGYAHRRLVYIHPYPCANGRTARLLSNLVSVKHGLPPLGFSPESEYMRAVLAGHADPHAWIAYLRDQVVKTRVYPGVRDPPGVPSCIA